MRYLSMVIITVEIFGSEIEQKLSKGRIFQFSWNEKNYHTKNETGYTTNLSKQWPRSLCIQAIYLYIHRAIWMSPPSLQAMAE